MQKIKKILMVTHEPIGPGSGGATQSARYIQESLSKDKGFEITIASAANYGEIANNGTPFGVNEFGDILVESHTEHDFQVSPADALKWLEVFENLNPDIIHLHHLKNIGIELPFLIKKALPRCKIVLSLHDYGIICMANAILKDSDGRSCYGASPRKCSSCIKSSMGRVINRQFYIRKGLEFVDQFLAPSKFLKEMYVKHDFAGSKIVFLPNLIKETEAIKNSQLKPWSSNKDTIHLQYIGQVLPHKGIKTLLDASLLLEKEILNLELTITISGSIPFSFRDFVNDHEAVTRRLVSVTGAYENSEVSRILRNTDVVVVPSLWFENDPLVIEEARLARVPVIASDIGALREKVADAGIGWNFQMGNSQALATLISKVARDRQSLNETRSRIPTNPDRTILYSQLYSNLLVK